MEGKDGPVPFRGTLTVEWSDRGRRFIWTVETRGTGSRITEPHVGQATGRQLAGQLG